MTNQKSHPPCDEHFVRHVDDDSTTSRAAEGFTLFRAFACAWNGIVYTFTTQRNLKIHTCFACLAVILGFLLRIDHASWLAIVVCIFVVMSLEVVNTAIESIVDLASPEWHELARAAKDCAAGAVYVAAIGSLVIAALVYIPAFLSLLS